VALDYLFLKTLYLASTLDALNLAKVALSVAMALEAAAIEATNLFSMTTKALCLLV